MKPAMKTDQNTLGPTPRTRLKRLPKRGSHEKQVIYDVLDEALYCHVAFVHDGHPFVLPTIHARIDDVLYFHGSSAGRMTGALKSGVPVCVNVTLFDGLVLARSAFHHSMNYRSVVILGEATEVTDEREKHLALERVVEHVVPGRGAELRPNTPSEYAATRVLRVPLTEASAKVRAGDPKDEEDDYALPVWAGVLPAKMVFGDPIPDTRLNPTAPVPAYLKRYRRS
jgi:uncharacterized protein